MRAQRIRHTVTLGLVLGKKEAAGIKGMCTEIKP